MSRSTSAGSSVTAAATTSRSTTATTTGLSRPLSLKPSADTVGPSNAVIFAAALRLLDLDLREDWPEITPQTFVGKDAQQNQKTRIRCTEWALYRLFEIWDPAETKEKLQPFFPPLEPLQSLNLRAALYRSLNELKKNGILGRECALRKTMLDECKGEKFMEILAVFASFVLKKVVQAEPQTLSSESVVRALSTTSTIPPRQREWIVPLTIAHKASLTAELKKKKNQDKRYHELSEMLELKSRQIARRKEQCKAQAEKSASKNEGQIDTSSIKRQLRDNWIGNPKWLDVLLHGDEAVSADDRVLELPFQQAWQLSEAGQLGQVTGSHQDLLRDLESRVKHQRQRLERWQNVHSRLGRPKRRVGSDVARLHDTTAEGVPSFSQHQVLKLGAANEPAVQPGPRSMPPPSVHLYQQITDTMKRELSNAAVFRRDRNIRPIVVEQRPFKSSLPQFHKRAAVPIPNRHEAEEEPSKQTWQEAERRDPPRRTIETAQRPRYSPEPPIPEPRANPVTPPRVQAAVAPQSPEIVDGVADDSALRTSAGSDRSVPFKVSTPTSPTPQLNVEYAAYPTPPTPILPEEVSRPRERDDEDVLANQILSSITAATPSPVKRPRPSLLERTRMSMAHNFPLEMTEPIEEQPQPSPEPIQEEIEYDRRASLLERTRQSMSVLAEQAARPRKSLARKSYNPRQSLFPVNQFETPTKPLRIDEEEFEGENNNNGRSTPHEQLFSEEADYNQVFKSRPKIAVSPVMTPHHDNGHVSFGDWEAVGLEE